MRLAAIYIPQNNLPHIFGRGHQGQVLNLGGKYIYGFSEDSSLISLIQTTPNSKFIEGFWGNDISMISAIVGRNGIGKTTLLRAINHPGDYIHQKLLYIYEVPDSGLHILNETEKDFSTVLANVKTINRTFEVQYYSPVLDEDLVSTLSSIALVRYHTGTLEEYYYDSIVRNIFLLNDPIIETIKSVYNDFPTYDKYLIRAKNHRRQHFKRPYIESNFANPNRGDVLKNYLVGDLSRLERDEEQTYTKSDFINLYRQSISMLESESFTELFTKIWDLEEYKFASDKGYLHNGENFVKNFEVTVLSYFILGAVFPQTGLGGSVDFEDILNATTFDVRLNMFLEMYLISEDEVLCDKIKADLGGINVSNKNSMIAIIENDKFSKLSGVDTKPIRTRMKRDIERFSLTMDFYNYLLNLINNGDLLSNGGVLEFNIKEGNIRLYFELIGRYKELLNLFQFLPVTVSILEFLPNKKLSTGEKSLIDFYASLNDYIERSKTSKHLNYEYYLLLLDEPELGYHPLWKKKFIKAIVETLPILFSKINPMKLDNSTNKYIRTEKENPELQIIFSTHDPLTLSDIPNDKIIFLDKNQNEETHIDRDAVINTFAANITDLLADSFFIDDGLIGDFAKDKIQQTIKWLQNKDIKEQAEFYKKLIKVIDEPIIQRKLAEMYDDKMSENVALSIIERQIKELQVLKKNLEKDDTP